MKYLMLDADILEGLVKKELHLDSLPQHPLYVYENGRYQEDPKTKPEARSEILAVGIDLGTTNSCVAVYTANGVEVIANETGSKTTPSCVLFDGNNVSVGMQAKMARSAQYKNRIYDAKRMLGKPFSDPQLQRDIKNGRFAFNLMFMTDR